MFIALGRPVPESISYDTLPALLEREGRFDEEAPGGVEITVRRVD